LPALLAVTNKSAQSGGYYGPDGEGEYGGFPTFGVIDKAALVPEVARKLWEVGIKNTRFVLRENELLIVKNALKRSFIPIVSN